MRSFENALRHLTLWTYFSPYCTNYTQENFLWSHLDSSYIYHVMLIQHVAIHTHLLQDSLYYLDANDSEDKPAIVVKQLVLALPENRLATLLSQQKYEEAEAFARKFDLDPEVCTCTWGDIASNV